MTSVETIIRALLRPEPVPFDPPSNADWRRLEARFGCRLDEPFKEFMALMSRFEFPGEILNVSTGRTNGNDPIELVYDLECRWPEWDPDMIPFFAIGNGDYFCLNRVECPSSNVYYRYLERVSFEKYSRSFEEWVMQLPQYLA